MQYDRQQLPKETKEFSWEWMLHPTFLERQPPFWVLPAVLPLTTRTVRP